MNNSAKQPSFPAPVALFLGILAVSTASIFIRYAQATTPSLVIAAFRLSLAALVLLPFAVATKREELRSLRWRTLGLAFLSGTFLAMHFATWITSLEYTSVASSVVLVTTNPLWVALVSPIFLRERAKASVMVGLALALVGGIVVSTADSCTVSHLGLSCPPIATFFQGTAFLGDFLALVGAWCAAGYLLIGRNLRQGMSLTAYTFLVYSAAAVVLLVAVGVIHGWLIGYPAQTYVWLVLLALIPQLVGHTTFNWALAYLPAAYVAVALLGEPVGSTILAFFLLSEVPNLIKLTGGVLILVGIYISGRSNS